MKLTIIGTGYVGRVTGACFAAMREPMNQPVIIDGRNQYDPKRVRAEGFEFFGIGR